MVKALIIDDEAGARETLRLMIEKYSPTLAVVGEAADITDGERLYYDHKPDLIFLDINMPNGTGLALLERLQYEPVDTIFTTAYTKYVMEAIRLGPIDYLLKPIHREELAKAVRRHVEKKARVAAQMGYSHTPSPQAHDPGRIAIGSADRVELVAKKDILYLASNRNYCTVYIVGGQSIVASKPLLAYENLLAQDRFLRVNKSILANTQHITLYKRGRGGSIQMSDGTWLEVARSRKADLLAALGA